MKNTTAPQVTITQTSITQTSITDHGIYVTATCGKVSALVCIVDYEVRVIVQNAAHKVWRGAGKGFPTVAAAIANYKKAEVQAIIAAADALNR